LCCRVHNARGRSLRSGLRLTSCDRADQRRKPRAVGQGAAHLPRGRRQK
jgi:hypothetical protein